jgi:large subunit ribosomal protein L29
MAKYKELRELSVEELEAQLLEHKKSLFNLRMRHATKELENTSQLRQERRSIAHVMTIISEKKRAATGSEA